MSHRLVRVLVVLASVLSLGCSGEPFVYRPELDAAAPSVPPEVPDPPAPQFPERSPGDHRQLRPTRPVLAAAARGANEIVIVDVSTGVTWMGHTFGGVLVDLAWEPTSQRLWVVEASARLDQARVHCFSLGGRTLQGVGKSETFAASARVLALGEMALVLSEDMATRWILLDAELKLLGPGMSHARPLSASVASLRDRRRIVALAPGLGANGADVDLVLTGEPSAGWRLAQLELPAAGRPASRLAGFPGRPEGWLVQKRAEEARFSLTKLAPFAPRVVSAALHRSVPGATGHLEEVVLDAQRSTLFALLADHDGSAALASIPLTQDAEGSVVELGARSQVAAWLARRLAFGAPGALLVATDIGVSVYRAVGDEQKPSLEPTLELDGFGPPLVLLD